MTRATAARVFFGLTAACVLVGLGIQVPVTADTAGHFATPLARVLNLFEMGRWASIANQFVHTIVPILGVLGWLLFGPRGKITRRIVWLSTLVPISWLVFTMIRGHFIDWYPYPFLDATVEGYVTVSINIVIVAVMFLAFAAGANLLDPLLPGRTDKPEPAPVR